jgi:hypothetical protein
MTLIESKTLGAAAASIEFTSIPQDGTDLVVFVSIRTESNAGFTWQSIKTQFNGSSSNLSSRILYGTGTAFDSFTDAAQILSWGSSNTATANTFGNTSLYVSNYTGSTNKTVSIDSVSENNAAAAIQVTNAALWANTSAITSISFTSTTGNLSPGCLISLYKITKGSDGIVTTS